MKIGDLGLSRGIAVDFAGEADCLSKSDLSHDEMQQSTCEALHPLEEHLTEYVVTRWHPWATLLLCCLRESAAAGVDGT